MIVHVYDNKYALLKKYDVDFFYIFFVHFVRNVNNVKYFQDLY